MQKGLLFIVLVSVFAQLSFGHIDFTSTEGTSGCDSTIGTAALIDSRDLTAAEMGPRILSAMLLCVVPKVGEKLNACESPRNSTGKIELKLLTGVDWKEIAINFMLPLPEEQQNKKKMQSCKVITVQEISRALAGVTIVDGMKIRGELKVAGEQTAMVGSTQPVNTKFKFTLQAHITTFTSADGYTLSIPDLGTHALYTVVSQFMDSVAYSGGARAAMEDSVVVTSGTAVSISVSQKVITNTFRTSYFLCDTICFKDLVAKTYRDGEVKKTE